MGVTHAKHIALDDVFGMYRIKHNSSFINICYWSEKNKLFSGHNSKVNRHSIRFENRLAHLNKIYWQHSFADSHFQNKYS